MVATVDNSLLAGLAALAAILVGFVQWIFRRSDRLRERRREEAKEAEEARAKAAHERDEEKLRTAVTLERIHSENVKDLIDRQKAEIAGQNARIDELKMQLIQSQERCTQQDLTYQRRCSLLEIECRRLRMIIHRLRSLLQQLGSEPGPETDPGPEPEFS